MPGRGPAASGDGSLGSGVCILSAGRTLVVTSIFGVHNGGLDHPVSGTGEEYQPAATMKPGFCNTEEAILETSYFLGGTEADWG